MEDGHSPTASDIDGHLYTLDVHQAQLLFDEAEIPRSLRSITRYCKTKRLDATLVDGPTGPEWRISQPSVVRAIDELKRAFSLLDTASHGEPQPAMAESKSNVATTETEQGTTQPEPDIPDSVGQGSATPRYVEQLEKRIDEKDQVITILRGELAQRNDELVRRNDRERETNILIRGLQNLVLQLQPARTGPADIFENDPLMQEREAVDNQQAR